MKDQIITNFSIYIKGPTPTSWSTGGGQRERERETEREREKERERRSQLPHGFRPQHVLDYIWGVLDFFLFFLSFQGGGNFGGSP